MLEVKWKEGKGATETAHLYRFNPCYVGSKMESPKLALPVMLATLFQSLLCWK